MEDVCARIDGDAACDSLRGCVETECAIDSDCKLIYSSCTCQAVPRSDPRDWYDPGVYDGGFERRYNSCTVDCVLATCRDGLCTGAYSPDCGG